MDYNYTKSWSDKDVVRFFHDNRNKEKDIYNRNIGHQLVSVGCLLAVAEDASLRADGILGLRDL